MTPGTRGAAGLKAEVAEARPAYSASSARSL